MIAYLSGKVAGFLEQKVIVKLPTGLGYLVTVSGNERLMVNDSVEMYVLHITREDSEELFGFGDINDRQWVEKLLKVNGIGPKVAAKIIYTLGWSTLQRAIITEDFKTIGSVKGLGPKTAKKIVLDLKGANADISAMSSIDTKDPTVSDFTSALVNMGYKRGDIIEVVARLKKDGKWNPDDMSAMLKLGLKGLR